MQNSRFSIIYESIEAKEIRDFIYLLDAVRLQIEKVIGSIS